MSDDAKKWDDNYMKLKPDAVIGDINMPNYYTFQQPEPSGWKCELFGMKGGVVFYPAKGSVPNWFWR